MENTLLVTNSSNVFRIGFFQETNTLEVEFKNGSVYQYFDVPIQIWEGFKAEVETGGSAGTFLNENIKGYFRYSKV